MLGAEERVMLPLLELAVESSDVTVPSVSSCLLACAWLAMLPKTTGRVWILLQTPFSLPDTGPSVQLSWVIFCRLLQSLQCLVDAWVDLSQSHQSRNV